MRGPGWGWLALGLLGCGAPVYIPREPPARVLPPETTGDTGAPTLPPTADTGLPTTTDTAPLPWPCSVDGGAPLSMDLRNQTTRLIRLVWVDPTCTEWDLQNLGSGQVANYNTWVGHVFLARDATTAEPVDWFVVDGVTDPWDITE